MSWHLLLPLASSLLYAASAMLLKRSAELGAGVVQTTAVVNLMTGAAFLTMLPLGGTIPEGAFWQAAITGLLYLAGQAFTFLSLKLGDVSVATPVLGIKTILVTGLATVLLGENPSWQIWLAAFLSAGAIALLNISKGTKRRVVATTLMSFVAAATYSLFDVLTQKWAPGWGAGRFLPVMAAVAALPAIVVWPIDTWSRRDKPLLKQASRAARPWLLAGAACMAIQGTVVTGTIAIFGDVTSVNLIYSARGLWAVAGVMVVGHWFRNDERLLAPSILRARLCGAAVMMAAIVLAITT